MIAVTTYLHERSLTIAAVRSLNRSKIANGFASVDCLLYTNEQFLRFFDELKHYESQVQTNPRYVVRGPQTCDQVSVTCTQKTRSPGYKTKYFVTDETTRMLAFR